VTHIVQLSNVTKSYGDVEVLAQLDLAIERGSFTALLGPSGCGKTTILNMIGGLDSPTDGAITISGKTVFDRRARINVPAERRNIGYVFQSYALWPHMTVGENVAYPLKIRGVSRADRDRQARDMLARLELIDLAERYPFQISGGQQQRVAIARALVYRAELMLLDEPLSNLDTQLRERARAWLASVHAEFGLTTVLVTHDQGEALSLSDRVVLLSRGRVAQDGSPTDVYDAPRSAYVADFVGGANLIKAKVISVEEKNGSNAVEVETVEGVRLRATSETAIDAGSSVQVVIRPHRIQIGAPGTLAGEGSA
jgi:iron(III) transport system ATP-binding protein